MEKDNGNPGLTDEVRNHEEGHRDQFIEGAKMDVFVRVDGKGYTGRADKVYTNVVNDVSKNAGAKMDRLKANLTSGKITQTEYDAGVKSVNEAAKTAISGAQQSIFSSVAKNIDSKMGASTTEDDANKRASQRAPLQYANHKRTIMYNKRPLPWE